MRESKKKLETILINCRLFVLKDNSNSLNIPMPKNSKPIWGTVPYRIFLDGLMKPSSFHAAC